jgi:hypothetical protein
MAQMPSTPFAPPTLHLTSAEMTFVTGVLLVCAMSAPAEVSYRSWDQRHTGIRMHELAWSTPATHSSWKVAWPTTEVAELSTASPNAKLFILSLLLNSGGLMVRSDSKADNDGTPVSIDSHEDHDHHKYSCGAAASIPFGHCSVYTIIDQSSEPIYLKGGIQY